MDEANWILDRWLVRFDSIILESQLCATRRFVEQCLNSSDQAKSYYQRLGVVVMESGLELLKPQKQKIILSGLEQIITEAQVRTGAVHSLKTFQSTILKSIEAFEIPQDRSVFIKQS